METGNMQAFTFHKAYFRRLTSWAFFSVNSLSALFMGNECFCATLGFEKLSWAAQKTSYSTLYKSALVYLFTIVIGSAVTRGLNVAAPVVHIMAIFCL